MRNLILCGMPACGKSTMGHYWADERGWSFIDTDEELEKSFYLATGHSYSCREIFQQEGEWAFREVEFQVLKKCLPLDSHVIALGGGTLDVPEHRDLVRKMGKICFLDVEIMTIQKRIEDRGVPPYLDAKNLEQSLQALADKRIPLFKELAHVTFSP